MLLWNLADLVRAADTRRSFRSKAYRRAVWALDDLSSIDAPETEILATPGIGPGIASLLAEYRDTGRITQLTRLEESYPTEADRLRLLPRMTPRMLRDLVGLGVDTVVDLRDAIASGAAATLPGAGPQTLQLWERIIDLSPGPGWVPAHEAWVISKSVANQIEKHTGATAIIAGLVRRVAEWVDRLDILIVTEERECVVRFLERTASLASLSRSEQDVVQATTHPGVPVQLKLTGPEAAGAALVMATGPDHHTSMCQQVTESHPSESDVYRAAGLSWVPPAARGLPANEAVGVVRLHQIRGDLHVHSQASPDGRMSLDIILGIALERGLDYVLITDHTRGLRFGGLEEDALAAQTEEISAVRDRFPAITVLHGAELNIDRDGSLDIADETLALLDFAVAGVHSHFGLEPAEQTARVVSALQHPVVRILAHPFGRRIGIRPPLELDMDEVIETAVANGVALETNGHRDRLDLGAEWLRRAVELGAVFAANSDAHRVDEMANIANAVATLQRAGIGPQSVINTLGVADLLSWVADGASRRPD